MINELSWQLLQILPGFPSLISVKRSISSSEQHVEKHKVCKPTEPHTRRNSVNNDLELKHTLPPRQITEKLKYVSELEGSLPTAFPFNVTRVET